ncbi:MAG: phosphate ABC transporter permease subunit PstC [Hyphomicrobiaceae bacterium]
MSTSLLLLLVISLAILGFALGYMRANSMTVSTGRPHSRAGYHGSFVFCATLLPALFLIAIWSAASPPLVAKMVAADLPERELSKSPAELSLTISTVEGLAHGIGLLSPEQIEQVRSGAPVLGEMLEAKGIPLAATPLPYLVSAALKQYSLTKTSQLLKWIAALTLAAAGLIFGFLRISPAFRARNSVESVMLAGLAAASTVAILTTVGIVFSMLFETIHFFQHVPMQDFFFGTVWDPRFSAAGRAGGSEGQFGILPLLWGTLYISIVALVVAVPVGLFSAIYMSEYASRRVRTTVKPLLEVLAGIPTIVYGFFALITVGPFLRDTGATIGLNVSATSVLTAGLVMGIMLIPFVSSLSDDIINAVPQSLRDGSYGLGATKSETIRRVVLPAALPGIVGAIMLAASRAIGETMIVVLAAGIAANLSWNLFEPLTTITVKIVSQLTGDLEFNSPQTLVAFALGLTLFCFTLALNIYALYMVRKYREQYE